MDITVAELAKLMADILDSKSQVVFDAPKPDGTPRKLLDVSNPTWLVPAYRPRGLTYP